MSFIRNIYRLNVFIVFSEFSESVNYYDLTIIQEVGREENRKFRLKKFQTGNFQIHCHVPEYS
jgi:hypothetical protein